MNYRKIVGIVNGVTIYQATDGTYFAYNTHTQKYMGSKFSTIRDAAASTRKMS